MKFLLPYDRKQMPIEIDDRNFAGTLVSKVEDFKPGLSQEQLVEASMDNPIGSPKLEDLAKGKKNIVIISSDHTRPVPSKIITPILLRRIRSVQSVLSSDYTSGNQPASQRDDLEYIASSNLSYAFNAHVGVNLAFEFDAGRNGLDGVANPSTRSFDRNLIFLGLLVKF